jgi:hypothetical protein
MRSFVAADRSSCEAGFLLVFLLPFLLLVSVTLAGSLKLAWSSQAKVALQSRLDLCALRLATERKKTLQRLQKSNQALALTITGIYLARGVKVMGPVGTVLGGASEAAMLRMNNLLAVGQEAEILGLAARETRHMRCAPTHYSREEAYCWPSPLALKSLRRETTFFPDVKGTLTHESRDGALARFRCRRPPLAASVELRGDARVKTGSFRDAYVE